MGPIWRDPRRNSAEFPAGDVQNGWMATQLVPKRCDFGSLGVPGPASTPKPLGPLGPRVGIINPPSTPWKAKVAIINPPALAWLACLLCPALAWSGLGLSCLPCLPCQACLPCLGLFQQQQPPWEGGVTGNKQWKKGYSVRLEQKSKKIFQEISNLLRKFEIS